MISFIVGKSNSMTMIEQHITTTSLLLLHGVEEQI